MVLEEKDKFLHAVNFGKSYLLKHDRLHPQFIGFIPDGSFIAIMANLGPEGVGTPEAKDTTALVAKTVFILKGCTAYVFMSEAWLKSLSAEESKKHMASGKGVVQYDDKIEVLLVCYEDQDNVRLTCSVPIKREGLGDQGKVLSFGKSQTSKDATGRFTKLLPPKGVVVTEREKGILAGYLVKACEREGFIIREVELNDKDNSAN